LSILFGLMLLWWMCNVILVVFYCS